MIIALVPAIAVGALYELFLRHRHDYAGHFLAGYGATLMVFMIFLRQLKPAQFSQWSVWGIVPLCLGCIFLGAIAEGTVTAIAKFDEIDFCNQSLGAVLAALVALGYASPPRPLEADCDRGVIVAIAFLTAGGCFAVT
jgi:peptidoglycan biosynthesis protein MviN/MurJ (putative lipid II flippase)